MPEIWDNSLSIGQLGARTGCKVPTIRYYEDVGLLSKARRTEGGHRVYGEEDVRRLSFIQRSRKLGFSLDAVRSLIELSTNRDRSCAEVDLLATAHLNEVEDKIRLLSSMREALEDLVKQCRHTTIYECRVIEALSPEPIEGEGAAARH
jgi:DNA-binding transcriptional MerR regulator